LLLAAGLSALLGLGSPLSAQWLQHPTAGIPRTPDGKADLRAPTPRTGSGVPDFSGLWQVAQRLPCNDVTRLCTDLPISAQFSNIGAGLPDGLPYSEWAREQLKTRQHKDDPYVRCLTPGGPRMHVLPMMQQIVQTPALMLMLNEYNTSYRQVHMDGRPLPVDPNPTWNGYSTGRWDGDTLVVVSRGFRDDQWLDTAGSPLTNAATVTERFRRSNFGTLEVAVTVEDVKAYTRPWTITIQKEVVVDSDMLDYVCLENEKDVDQLQSR
jgi:hypothetical protein